MRTRQRERGMARMDRRGAFERLIVGAGTSAAAPVLGNAEPQTSEKNWRPRFFDEHQNETVVALSSLNIPDTEPPGAKAALANRLIDLRLSAAIPDLQKQYLEALGWLDGHCLALYLKPFTKLGAGEQREVVNLLTHSNDDPKIAYGANLFRLIKGSIVEAYCSLGIGTLQELKYETKPSHAEIPGCAHPEEHSGIQSAIDRQRERPKPSSA